MKLKDLIPSEVKTFKEKLDFLHENKQSIFDLKKAAFKEADAMGFPSVYIPQNNKLSAVKIAPGAANIEEWLSKDFIDVECIINTTNVIDSHLDLHLKKIWNKTVRENKRIKHLQEHNMSFKSIIADRQDLKAVVKTFRWKELGVDANGTTEALTFLSRIWKSRNLEMFENYAKGYVDNHSVGMWYETLFFCVNSEEKWWAEEKENFDKYIKEAINPEVAEKEGVFWAVSEARAVEGSAVVVGSNIFTPTRTIDGQDVTPAKATSRHSRTKAAHKGTFDGLLTQVKRFNK